VGVSTRQIQIAFVGNGRKGNKEGCGGSQRVGRVRDLIMGACKKKEGGYSRQPVGGHPL